MKYVTAALVIAAGLISAAIIDKLPNVFDMMFTLVLPAAGFYFGCYVGKLK